jgi:DNA-binding NarL/FixJ family response regulator
MVHPAPEGTAVFLVCDAPATRRGLSLLLAEHGLAVCGEDDRLEAALARLPAPPVVLVDVSFQDLAGADAARLLSRCAAHAPVLVLSGREDALHVQRALSAGVAAYVSKREEPAALARALREVAGGRGYVSAHLARALAAQLAQVAEPELYGRFLSDQEREVFRLMGAGFAAGDIARRLSVHPHTVRTYYGRLQAKLGLASVAALRRQAIEAARAR